MADFFQRFITLVTAIFVATLAISVSPGCATTPHLSNPFTVNKPKTPERMVYVWMPYEQTNPVPGGPPLRGIGGRFFFYESTNARKPVKVDGELTIFIFDGDVEMNNLIPGRADPPIHQFVITREQLEQSYVKHDLGHSYEIFLPIDALGNPEMRLCVISRFDDARSGRMTTSSQHAGYITLPGPLRERVQNREVMLAHNQSPAAAAYQQVGAREAIAGGASDRGTEPTARALTLQEERDRRTVTTISKPTHLSR